LGRIGGELEEMHLCAGEAPTGVEGRRDCRQEGRLAGRAACEDDVYVDGVIERRQTQLLLAVCLIPHRYSKRRWGGGDG